MRNQKFYICKTCGNLVGKLEGNVAMTCCGKVMEELVPNTVEASGEKHLPVYTLKDNVLEVSVGSVLHPMSEEHNISFVYVETKKGGQRKNLEVGKDPKISFSLIDDDPLSVFAYCNLRNEFRFFKIGRIESATILSESFTRKDLSDADLPLNFWHENMDTCDVVMEIDKKCLSDVEEWLGIENVKAVGEKFIATAKLPFDNGLVSKIISFGSGITVVEPQELKEQIKVCTKEILENYK